jgi:hypothetical protein
LPLPSAANLQAARPCRLNKALQEETSPTVLSCPDRRRDTVRPGEMSWIRRSPKKTRRLQRDGRVCESCLAHHASSRQSGFNQSTTSVINGHTGVE